MQNMMERRLFSVMTYLAGTDFRDLTPSTETTDGSILLDQSMSERVGGVTTLAIDVAALANTAALADFALLGKVHRDGSWHTLISGATWGTVAGILKHKVGALNTLAAGAAGLAYVDIGPLYAIKFQAKGGGTDKATNGTFTGNATGWSLNASDGTIAYSSNHVAFTAATGTMKQLLASMTGGDWVDGNIHEVSGVISNYTGGSLWVGTNTEPEQYEIAADGAFQTAITADAHADGLVFTADGFTGDIDGVVYKPMAYVQVLGSLYR